VASTVVKATDASWAGELVLGFGAGAEVAEDAEFERAILVRQWHQRFGRRLSGLNGGDAHRDAAVQATGRSQEQEEEHVRGGTWMTRAGGPRPF
jgi:hypothetical protein